MAAYDKSYVFPLDLTDAWKQEITSKTREKLTEMLGVEVDNVMAEYVIVMVSNKKNMEQIANDLVDFIGDEAAEQFVAWLSQLLPTFETQSAADVPVEDTPATELQDEELPAQIEQQKEVETPHKRVVSLKGLSSSSEAPKKKMVSLSSSRGTLRSLNPSKTDMDDVIARRAQRFGVVEKKPAAKKSPSSGKEDRHQRDESRATGNKRRANERDGGKDSNSRLSQRLGPPVNVDQAELDARDTLGSHKKRRGDRDDNQRGGGRANRRNDRDRDHDMEDAGRNGKRRNNDSRESAPPLPPSDEKGDFKGKQGYGQGMGPPMGFQGGPMGYGGFPPPYGGPMFYPPPGYGPMNPYAMGFPPQGMPPYGGRGYPRPQGMQNGPRGARPFQNRKWVNPNVAKAEEEAKATEGNPESDATGSDANSAPQNTGMNPGAPAFAPRNPYFSSQMRPRFQNKTWVRQDPAKDEELNSSLPKTPPKELLESTD
ncbi:Zinc finger CCCH domain-containing protein 14 [Phytophthora citrophthora]|uniref:Zinc finger CCCH domain-containing protein 14 n=1 Tax=Phytophthora citrophthora TaxID=4793 RepID=A0AAD9G053_9STRA|nr:Zinc finger CCCH domain-containing protein 14 [Phytophthora citrophthora]